MAQSFLDNAKLDFEKVSITNPRENTFWIDGVISTEKSLIVPVYLVDSTLKFNYSDSVVGSVFVNSTKLEWINGKSHMSISNDFEITNKTAFSEFSKDMIRKEFVKWIIHGDVIVKVLGIKYRLKMNRTLEIQGLNEFPDIILDSYDMTRSNETHIFLDLKVNVLNPSVISIAPVGTLTLDVFYKESLVGYASMSNLSIVPGDNLIYMNATCETTDLEKTSELITKFIAGRELKVTSVAPKNGNVSDIPLFNDALEGIVLNMHFQPQPTQLVKGMSFKSIFLEPASQTHLKSSILVTMEMYNPLGYRSPVFLYNISMTTDLIFRNQSIGTMETQSVPIHNNISTPFDVEIDTFLKIKDYDLLIEFIDDVVNYETVETGFRGLFSTWAKIALGDVLISDVPVTSITTIKGLDGMKGAQIVGLDLPRDHENGGIAFIANATFENPSIISIHLGEVYLDLYKGSTILGHAFCNDLFVKPGENLATMEGQIIPAVNTTVTSEVVSNFVKGISQEADAKGVRSGDDSIPWLTQAIQRINLHALIIGLQDFNPITDIGVEELTLDFDGREIPVAMGSMRGYYTNPFGFSFQFVNCTISVTLNDEKEFGHVLVVNLPITQYEGSFTVEFNSTDVVVLDKEIFSQFVATLFIRERAPCLLTGTATSVVDTTVGRLTVMELPFANLIYLNGTNRFLDPPVVITEMDLLGGNVGVVAITMNLNFFNPSSAQLIVGPLTMNLFYKDMYLGNGTLPDLSLFYGWNTYKVTGYYIQTPENTDYGRELFSLFLQGKDISVSFAGDENSTENELLKKAMSLFSANATIPGMPDPLISYAHLILSIEDILGKQRIPAELTVENPYSATIQITDVNINMYFNGHLIGQLNQSFVDDPIIVPPKKITITPIIYANIVGFDWELLKAINGIVYTDVVGDLTARIGDFEQQVDYVQNRVPSSFLPQDPSEEDMLMITNK